VAAGVLHEHVESPRHSDCGYEGREPQRTSSSSSSEGTPLAVPCSASVADSRDG